MNRLMKEKDIELIVKRILRLIQAGVGGMMKYSTVSKKLKSKSKTKKLYELCEEASKASKEWNLKFQLGSKKGKSM